MIVSNELRQKSQKVVLQNRITIAANLRIYWQSNEQKNTYFIMRTKKHDFFDIWFEIKEKTFFTIYE